MHTSLGGVGLCGSGRSRRTAPLRRPGLRCCWPRRRGFGRGLHAARGRHLLLPQVPVQRRQAGKLQGRAACQVAQFVVPYQAAHLDVVDTQEVAAQRALELVGHHQASSMPRSRLRIVTGTGTITGSFGVRRRRSPDRGAIPTIAQLQPCREEPAA